MASFWTDQSGNLLVDGNGDLFWCDDCPCGDPCSDQITKEFTCNCGCCEVMPTQYSFILPSGLSDNFNTPVCGSGTCPGFSGLQSPVHDVTASCGGNGSWSIPTPGCTSPQNDWVIHSTLTIACDKFTLGVRYSSNQQVNWEDYLYELVRNPGDNSCVGTFNLPFISRVAGTKQCDVPFTSIDLVLS